MKPYLMFWVVWLLVGATYEVWAVWFRPAGDDTLSELTMYLFKAGTMWGWYALMILMGFLAAWFPGHVRHLAQMKQAKTKVTVTVEADDRNTPDA